MVVIKPQEIKILCMPTHIPSQEKPEALCSGKNLHMHRHIHSVPLCARNTMEHEVSGFSAHYHFLRLFSTFGGCQETCPWKFRHLVEEKDDPSYSLRKKYWCYVWKLLDVAVSDFQRLWNPHFQFNSSCIFMQLLVFLMSPLCLSTLGSSSQRCELLGWMLFLHLGFGVSLVVLRSSFRLIHNIIYTFMYKPTLSPHIK